MRDGKLSRLPGQAHPRALMLGAIMQLIQSPAGILWIDDGPSSFKAVSSKNVAAPKNSSENKQSSLACFLGHTGWVINLDEINNGPPGAPNLELPMWLDEFKDAWLIAPLMLQQTVFGFVVLAKPHVKRRFSWEDRDLLKTIGPKAIMKAVRDVLAGKHIPWQ